VIGGRETCTVGVNRPPTRLVVVRKLWKWLELPRTTTRSTGNPGGRCPPSLPVPEVMCPLAEGDPCQPDKSTSRDLAELLSIVGARSIGLIAEKVVAQVGQLEQVQEVHDR
jgi:hypothetical protein